MNQVNPYSDSYHKQPQLVLHAESNPFGERRDPRGAASEVFAQAGRHDAIQGTPLPMIDLDIITDR